MVKIPKLSPHLMIQIVVQESNETTRILRGLKLHISHIFLHLLVGDTWQFGGNEDDVYLMSGFCRHRYLSAIFVGFLSVVGHGR
jgi:hypothetical protein